MGAQQEASLSYKDTLNLPQTNFPIRAQADIFDPQLLARWKEQNLYEKCYVHNEGKQKFILHDGPPYANGDIHIGHAYNKILKDIIAKSERMSGKHVPIIPGWDCHGLPIELKVTKEQPGLEKPALKKACRAYAQLWIKAQSEQFQQLGVIMHWAKPYLTMNFSYEASIMRAFKKFVQGGYIEKKQKTVPWCPSCQTVLATAEIEYQERKDPSLYVQFPLQASTVQQIFPKVAGRKVSMLVWTTTPWTLPLNRAVVIKPGALYQLVEINDQLVIIGKELVQKVAAALQTTATVVEEFAAGKIAGQLVQHPFISLLVPVIEDQFVSLEDGTACVHSAPGCGPEDYEVGIKNNLEIYSPLTVDGRYSSEIVPAELAGMPVADGQIWVIKKLTEVENLLHKSTIRHSYPHCWRCHNGLIFRATSQWFCNLARHNLKEKALLAIEQMKMLPETGRKRLSATVDGRLEWCLSRQRTWGVPIPAVLCADCDFVYTSPAFIEKVATGVEQEGIEFWDSVELADVLDTRAVCTSCGSKNLRKEHDILDVWFDSGISHYAVLHDGVQQYPADLYLEGKDQHRGWFQSSLLTSLVLEEQASMKEIVTHGFTVDGNGRKMSKSIGNVVSPAELIKRMGTDGVRLWVASNDYDSDPVVSDNLLNNVSEVYRKIRNTCRFLLSNLYDFDIEKDAVAIEELYAIDQYALHQLHEVNQKVIRAYQERKTTAVFHELADYCVKELSGYYLDIIKDRLYVEQADGRLRRSAQTVCWYIVDTMTKMMAPVLSFTAELVSDEYQRNKTASIHLQDYADLSGVVALLPQSADMSAWAALREMRSYVLKELEVLRAQGIIKHSLEAQVSVTWSEHYAHADALAAMVELITKTDNSLERFLQEYCIVSFVTHNVHTHLPEVAPGLCIGVTKADGSKCQRCWQWDGKTFDDARMLCGRCTPIVV